MRGTFAVGYAVAVALLACGGSASGPGPGVLPDVDAGPAAPLPPAPATSDAAAADDGPGQAAPDAGVDTGAHAAEAGAPARLEGAAQGPLSQGSKVTLTLLDPRGEPLPAVSLTATTSNDLGEFSFPHPGPGLAELVAVGSYWGQSTRPMRGPVTLRALVDLAAPLTGRVHLNAITHICAPRIRWLLRMGSTFAAATAQAEGELRKAIGLVAPAVPRPATTVDLFGTDDDDSAYLLVLSLVFAGDPDVNRWLEASARDLEPDGVLTVNRWLFTGPGRSFDVPEVEQRLRGFLAAQSAAGTVGVPTIIPNLLRVLDFDGDGTADLTDADADGDGVAAGDDGVVDSAPNSACLALGRDGRVWAACLGGPTRLPGLERIVSITSEDDRELFALRDDGVVLHAADDGEDSAMPWHAEPIPGVTRAKAIFSLDRGPNQVPTTLLVLQADGIVLEVNPLGVVRRLNALTGAVHLASSALSPGQPIFAARADGTVTVTLATDRATGIAVPNVDGAIAVFSGAFDLDCAIKTDRTVWCWGYQGGGARRPRPAVPMEGFTGAISASSSNGSVTIVKADGTVWLWAPFGRTSQPPLPVPGITGAVKATPHYPTVVLDRDGTLTRHYYNDQQPGDPPNVPVAGHVTAVRIPR